MSVKPRYTMHGGYRMPLGFPAENFSSALEYRAEPGDIILSTYPKCGTTWVQYIIYLLFHGAEPLRDGESLGDAIPHLEEVGAEAATRLPQPRVIKTHFTREMTPYHPDARYLVVARNPFDCAVSFFHHTRGFVKHYDFAAGTFDDYFECFIKGEVDSGDYFDHLGPWFEARLENNVLFLTYEEMKRDSTNAVAKIATFLSLPEASNPEFLSRVVEQSSFSRMREDQDRWSSRRPDDMPAFVRRGIVGDWKNLFSDDQARRLADKFDDEAKRYGFGALWPEQLREARQE